MNYSEFKNKYLGKPIDWDGKYGRQCVDVYRQYCNELGLKQSPPVVGANNIWDTYLQSDWDRIVNTTEAITEQGDVIIWGTKVGQYGHVAICDSANKTSFISIDQNWPVDNGTGVLHEVKHTYTGVLGWLRCKIKPVSDLETDMTAEETNILKFIKEQGANEGKVREAFGALSSVIEKDKQIQTLQARVLDLEKSQKDLEDRLTALESNIQADLKLITDWQNQCQTANKKVEQLSKEVKEQSDEKNQWKNRYEAALKEQVNKYTGWQLIKMGISKLKLKK